MGHEIAIAKGNPSRTLFIHSDLSCGKDSIPSPKSVPYMYHDEPRLTESIGSSSDLSSFFLKCCYAADEPPFVPARPFLMIFPL